MRGRALSEEWEGYLSKKTLGASVYFSPSYNVNWLMNVSVTGVKLGAREASFTMASSVGPSVLLPGTTRLQRCSCKTAREGREKDWRLQEDPRSFPDDEAIITGHSNSKEEGKHHNIYYQRKQQNGAPCTHRSLEGKKITDFNSFTYLQQD